MSRNSSLTNRWVADVQSQQFSKVKEEIQSYEFDDSSMLRLLVCLCNTSEHCSGTGLGISHNITSLCITLCKNFRTIPNTSEYFNSLYFIISDLLEKYLFEDAMVTCNYLLPSSLWHHQMTLDQKTLNSNYWKLTSIFDASIAKFLKSLKPGSINETIFQRILTIVHYQLKINDLAVSYGSTILLRDLLYYTGLLQDLHCPEAYLDDFTNYLFINYLRSIKLTLGKGNRSSTYQTFTKIITNLSVYYIKQNRFEKLQTILTSFLRNFESCMLESEESSKCYQIFINFVKNVIKPLKNYVREDSNGIKRMIEEFQEQIRCYGEDSLVKYNVYSIASILEALFSNWKKSPSAEIILSTTKLLNYLSGIIERSHSRDIPFRCGKLCGFRHDFHKSLELKTKILDVLHRFHPKSPSPEFYEQFKVTSSQCMDIIPYLRGIKCEKWKDLWVLTGSTIYYFTFHFNYEDYRILRLCTSLGSCIVKLKADEIFFENNPIPPLSLVLHTLSRHHYANRSYHQARIFTAINICLYPEDPASKAYLRWSDIHCKDPRSKGLSLVNFIRNYSQDLRVLGLGEMKITNEVLRSICIREIKSHIGMKTDMTESIIAVVNDLEALNADDITYGTAVHQLGHHCYNFQTRPNIYNYVKNAIGRLRRVGPNDANFKAAQKLVSELKLYEFLGEISRWNRPF